MNLQSAYHMLCSADLYCMVFQKPDEDSAAIDKIFADARCELFCEASKLGMRLDHNDSDLRKWQRIRTLESQIKGLGVSIVEVSYDWEL